ncbi:MAG: DEAD/DEAH box helicase [Anaerolineaceae bacterium]|nr:DEAD/DEAH box helicase [Anaerolineaceae bacterium]
MTEQNNENTNQPESNNTDLSQVALKDLPEIMQTAVKRAGWTELSPVQSQAIPFLRANRDMMVQAQTGSGKTGAFILPIIEKVNPKKNYCQAIVLVPTRELAQQVAADAQVLAGEKGMRVVAVYGGSSYKPQIEGFKKGAHLVVGTPGRILDHLIKRNLTLDKLESFVFDEADRMMSMGFFPDMLRIHDFLPDRRINTTMFSATFTLHVKSLAHQFMKSPGFLSLSRDQIHVEDTRHVFYYTPGMDKDRALVRIIEMENPHQTIIFCNTKDRVYYVTRVLQRFGYNADQLSSDLSQNIRDKVLKRLRDGQLRFLVATDVAARGIDIPDLSHVIQYEPPDELEAYIHRAGRTGRAGATGTAIMLINFNERRQLKRIGAHFSLKFEELALPQNEDVEALVSERLIGQLEGNLRSRDRLENERMQRFIPLAKQLANEEEGIDLLAMLLDSAYHSWMHKPPELPPVGTIKQPHSPAQKSNQRRTTKKPRSRRNFKRKD